MVTAQAIADVRRRASVSSLDAVRALSLSDGDTERALDYLARPRLATRSLEVRGSPLAARLAARLIGDALWFECEQLDRERWRFAVAPAFYSRLVATHEALGAGA
jgi:hypothetical protein